MAYSSQVIGRVGASFESLLCYPRSWLTGAYSASRYLCMVGVSARGPYLPSPFVAHRRVLRVQILVHGSGRRLGEQLGLTFGTSSQLSLVDQHSASEGIDLQNHCHSLVHYAVRLEGRSARCTSSSERRLVCDERAKPSWRALRPSPTTVKSSSPASGHRRLSRRRLTVWWEHRADAE